MGGTVSGTLGGAQLPVPLTQQLKIIPENLLVWNGKSFLTSLVIPGPQEPKVLLRCVSSVPCQLFFFEETLNFKYQTFGPRH